MTEVFEGYTQQTVMFGDGAHGSAMQISKVKYKGEETGITVTWTRKNRSDKGTLTYTFADQDYPDIANAIAAYEESKT